jgi:hypothetical protein
MTLPGVSGRPSDSDIDRIFMSDFRIALSLSKWHIKMAIGVPA